MLQAIKALPPTAAGSTIAEGIAVKRPGRLTRPVIEALVDDILLVGEEAIERANAAAGRDGGSQPG